MIAKPLPISEAVFLQQVIELAEILGWEAAHFRPALTRHGWRTPVQGSLGKGFPDLLLCNAKQRRIVLAELKVTTNPDPDQVRVLRVLADSGVEVYVWRPDDFDEIQAALR